MKNVTAYPDELVDDSILDAYYKNVNNSLGPDLYDIRIRYIFKTLKKIVFVMA